MKHSRNILYIQIFIAISLALNVMFWFSVRDVRVKWGNVPPAPDIKYASSMGLGDTSFAYRSNGIIIQNLGDAGGRVTPLKDYDYEDLTNWFFLQDELDSESNYIPYLAAYYFSAVQEPEKFYPVLEYLKEIGSRPGDGRWRWLAQAVYISRFLIKDTQKAAELADVLVQTAPDDVPAWVNQMPVFILKAQGKKEEAYALMLEILKSNVDNMHPNEVNASRAYICDQILSEEQKKSDPICQEPY